MAVLSAADDRLQTVAPDATPAWFDRFYFNLHSPAGTPFLVAGAGLYPGQRLADGYVCALIDGEQRNLRLSHQPAQDSSVGPLSWETLEPLRSWRLRLDANPSGLRFDLVWTARTVPFAVDPIRVSAATDFTHFFQSGRYTGELEIDGTSIDVDGWFGQRDRSRGLRQARDRLGLHLWLAAQLPDRCLALNFNLDRSNRPVHCDGALLGEDGSVRRIAAVRHALELDERDELRGGTLVVELEDGEQLEVMMASESPGLYMAGAGYGGWHGVPRGAEVAEAERWPLDGALDPRELALGLVDKPCRFTVAGVAGHGLAEIAVSRSSSYRYAGSPA